MSSIKTFYQSENISTEEDISVFFHDLQLPHISEEQRAVMEAPINEQKIRKAISMLKEGRSPGLDGLPAEYYKKFIDILAPELIEVLSESFKNKQLPQTFKEALITLIPKKDRDTTLAANYRPISLCNADGKILSKISAARMEQVLPSIIHKDQVGFMKKGAPQTVSGSCCISYGLTDHPSILSLHFH